MFLSNLNGDVQSSLMLTEEMLSQHLLVAWGIGSPRQLAHCTQHVNAECICREEVPFDGPFASSATEGFASKRNIEPVFTLGSDDTKNTKFLDRIAFAVSSISRPCHQMPSDSDLQARPYCSSHHLHRAVALSSVELVRYGRLTTSLEHCQLPTIRTNEAV